jgi:DNA-binding response OmpR family regulator
MRELARRTPVLVVEDDAHLREYFRSTLAAVGFAASAVEDGLDALRHIEVTPPRAIVLDLGLPRLSGVDLYRELRAHPRTRDIAIVVVTGKEHLLDEEHFDCVLRKPVLSEQLLFAVEDCLSKARRKE